MSASSEELSWPKNSSFPIPIMASKTLCGSIARGTFRGLSFRLIQGAPVMDLLEVVIQEFTDHLIEAMRLRPGLRGLELLRR